MAAHPEAVVVPVVAVLQAVVPRAAVRQVAAELRPPVASPRSPDLSTTTTNESRTP